MSDYEVFARDSNFGILGVVDEYFRMGLTLRFNAVSLWRMMMPLSGNGAEFMVKRNGVVIERDGEVLLSGPVRGRRLRWSVGSPLVLEVWGSDDLTWVAERVALPETSGDFAAQSHDVRTGAAESVLYDYIYYNAGAGALSDRRVAGLSLAADLGRGESITGRARFDQMDVFMAELAELGGGLGVKVVQLGSGIEFAVYVPEDKSGDVVFSPDMENLVAFTYEEQAPTANYIYMGGQDQGASRTIETGSDPESVVEWGARIEKFKDQRNAEDGELSSWMRKAFEKMAGKRSLSITPIDTEMLKFGRDYGLGDMVKVDLTNTDGIEIVDVVREVNIDLDGNGESVKPVVGTAGSGDPDGLLNETFDRILDIDSRLRMLEVV